MTKKYFCINVNSKVLAESLLDGIRITGSSTIAAKISISEVIKIPQLFKPFRSNALTAELCNALFAQNKLRNASLAFTNSFLPRPV
jgi:hypothetical protein